MVLNGEPWVLWYNTLLQFVRFSGPGKWKTDPCRECSSLAFRIFLCTKKRAKLVKIENNTRVLHRSGDTFLSCSFSLSHPVSASSILPARIGVTFRFIIACISCHRGNLFCLFVHVIVLRILVVSVTLPSLVGSAFWQNFVSMNFYDACRVIQRVSILWSCIRQHFFLIRTNMQKERHLFLFPFVWSSTKNPLFKVS